MTDDNIRPIIELVQQTLNLAHIGLRRVLKEEVELERLEHNHAEYIFNAAGKAGVELANEGMEEFLEKLAARQHMEEARSKLITLQEFCD